MEIFTRARAGYVATLAAGVAIGFSLVGAASAAPTAPAAPAAPAVVRTVTHHLSLAASAFAPDGIHNTAQDYFNLWDPSTLTNQDGTRCFNTGIVLPTDATMKSITVYYTKGTGSLFFNFNRQNLPKHAFKILASFSAGTSTTPVFTHTTKSIGKANAVVNYTNYAYSAGACPTGNTTFTGLTITYTEPRH